MVLENDEWKEGNNDGASPLLDALPGVMLKTGFLKTGLLKTGLLKIGLLEVAVSLLCLLGASVTSAEDDQQRAQQGAQPSTQYEAGKHYVLLDIPVRMRDPNLVEVTEYFAYSCAHCYTFEPLINQWKYDLPEGVIFNRTPAIWSSLLEFFAQTYYTAETLGVLEVIHTPLFQALHIERRNLNNPEAMAEFFSEYGVDTEDFMKAFNSFGVKASRQQADARGRAYRASGTPAIIVNGKYRIDGSMAGSNAAMLEVAEVLIQRELEQRQNQYIAP